MSFARWQQFCSVLNVLMMSILIMVKYSQFDHEGQISMRSKLRYTKKHIKNVFLSQSTLKMFLYKKCPFCSETNELKQIEETMC